MTNIITSKHLTDLLAKRSGSVDAQVVFIDIISYSRRKTTVQKRVIDRLQSDIKFAITEVGKKYLEYIQSNNINFSTDVIVLPTGDGAAIAFTFGGVQSLPLDFALILLKRIYDEQSSKSCKNFDDNGWCNCHDHYTLRIAINEGKAILFEDINGQANLAGTCLNDAARIMGKADASQILLSESAYINIIDMSSDNALDNKIVSIGTAKVKHDRELNVYQYVGEDESYISKTLPVFLELENEMKHQMSRMGLPKLGNLSIEPGKMLEVAKMMGEVMDQMTATLPTIDASIKKLP